MDEFQRAGDKSGEISVAPSIRTNDDSLLEIASQDHNADDASFSDDDDDNVSYDVDDEDENELNLYDVEEVDEDLYRPRSRTHSRVEELHPAPDVQDARNRGNGSNGSISHDDDEEGMTQYEGVDFRREEIDSFLQELVDDLEESGQISVEQHKDALMQLNAKWQEALDQTIDEQEQQLESLVQDRNESELRAEAELNGLRQVHQEELGAVKEQVMESSQKIILQEMKVNAERERKYEEAFEFRVQEVVDASKKEMNEEFDIALAGMMTTQEEIEKRYKKMLKEKEISVRGEVIEEANKASETKISVFMSQYEDMKNQVVDLTMEIQTLQIEIDSKEEEKNDEIEQLRAILDEEKKLANEEFELKVQSITKTHKTTHEQLQVKINGLTSSLEMKEKTGGKAYLERINKLEKEHQIEIESMRSEEVKNKKELDELNSMIERNDIENAKSVKEACSQAVEDLKKKYELEILAEAKSVQKTEKEIADKIESLEKKRMSQIDDLTNELEKKKRLIAKHESIIESKDGSITTLTKKFEESSKNKAMELKSQVDRLKMGFAREKALSKDRFEEHTRKLQEMHKSEMENLRVQLKTESTENKAKHGENGSQSSSLQLNPKSQEPEVIVISKQSKEDAREKSNISLDESQGALADLQREVQALKSTSKLHNGFINEKSNSFTPMSDRTTNNSTKSNEKENDKNVNLAKKGENQHHNVLPKEIELQSEQLKVTVPNENEGDENSTVVTNISKKADSPPHSPRERKVSPTNLPQSNEYQFPDLSPLTLGSPSLKRTPQRKASRVVPSSMPRGISRRKSNKIVPLNLVASTTKKKKILSQTPRLSQRLNSSTKSSLLKNKLQTPGTFKTQTSVSSPPRRLITPRNRRRDSFSSFGSSFGTSVAPNDNDMRLMIINVPYTEKLKKMTKALKLEVVEDPLLATHVIAGDSSHPMRRTWKLMASLCVTSFILKAEWLEESFKGRTLLSFNRYLLLNDSVAEKAFKFSMKNTLREGNERRRDGGLLSDWSILLCDNVAGNKAPKEAELHTMIGAAGGKIIYKDDIPLPPANDPTHVIVITSDPALPGQLQDSNAQVAAENGAGFFTTSWLFDCMMHQKLFGIRRGLGR